MNEGFIRPAPKLGHWWRETTYLTESRSTIERTVSDDRASILTRCRTSIYCAIIVPTKGTDSSSVHVTGSEAY
jgi:hypothetical protein